MRSLSNNKYRTKQVKVQSMKYNITERKKRKKYDIKRIISTYFCCSSIYILNRIGKSKTFAQKSFWTIILISGVIGFFSQVAQFLSSYYSYPVIINLDSINSKEQVFPAVTVCNVNSIRKQFESCLFKNLNYDQCIGVDKEQEYDVLFDEKNTSLPECDMDLNIFPSKNESLSNWFFLLHSQDYESRIKYGHNIDDFVQYCAYRAKICSSKHFRQSISHAYGNCYTFNIGKQKLLANEYGPLSGLVLELNLETEKYATFTRTVGAKVHIHDPYLEHSIDTKGVFISPGYETSIAVTKSVISRLKPPYKDHCKKYELGDSQSDCAELCYDNITLSLCSCSTGTKIRNGIRECDLTEPLVWCCLAICERFLDRCDCPLACEEFKYDIQISTTAWPSRSHFEKYKAAYLERNISISYEKFRETRLRLAVYYDNLDYIEYKQNPMYQSSQIFSQVGAQMGLWLGMSLVFIFEFFEALFYTCRMRK